MAHTGGWMALALLIFSELGAGPFLGLGRVSAPFMLLAIALKPRTVRVLCLAGLIFGVELVLAGQGSDGMWQIERGWAVLVAGGFVMATSMRSRWTFIHRGLIAIGGAVGVSVVVFAATGAQWGEVEALVGVHMQEAVGVWLETWGEQFSDPTAAVSLEERLGQLAEMQVFLIPATLALTSLSALGAVWWVWCRLTGQVARALMPLSEFRFREELVWVMILGIALALPAFGGRVSWAGLNIMVVMGVLYALRGAGVIVASFSRSSWAMKALLGVVALLFPPGAAFTLILVGLGDNWIDFRARILKNGEVP